MINNVETYTNIVPIMTQRRRVVYLHRHGAEQRHQDLRAQRASEEYRVWSRCRWAPRLRKMIFDIGGGVPEGHTFKAVQTGGPAGGCIPAAHLDAPIDYESLQSLGIIHGFRRHHRDGRHARAWSMSPRYFMEFCMSESCGKCVPCRVGTAQMYSCSARISRGEATLDELAQLESLCDVVTQYQPVRSRPGRAQSGAQHAALFP